MKLDRQVCIGHIVLNGDPAHPHPPPKKKWGTAPIFGRVYCGQAAGWINMPLGTEVGLGPVDIALDGAHKRGTPPIFGPYLLWPNGRPSQLLRSSSFKSCGRLWTIAQQ